MLFTAIIFSVLWLLQTVFFQSFYNAMLIHNTKEVADRIIAHSDQSNINEQIDELTHDNNILVFITDTNGKTIYSSDAFNQPDKRMRKNDEWEPRDDIDQLPEKPQFSDGVMVKPGNLRVLPQHYDEFLATLRSSEEHRAEYSTESLYIYGAYIDYYGQSEKAVLYVSAAIDTVGPSVAIISMQLVWVTVLSVLIGFVLSWFIAKRFARPVDHLREKAKKLGESSYRTEFEKGFCSELDELNGALDTTNEKLLRAKDFQMELLANVSHDLRTPLTMIKGYAEMIQDISWNDEEQCKSDLSVIIKEADRLTSLVNEILEYSELQTEGGRKEFETVDLSSMMERIADTFETLYKPDGLHVERKIGKDITVSGDAGLLERAVYNLMDNAVRHTGDSKTVKVALYTEKERIMIDVTDYGNGISKEEAERIFERYYTSRQRSGKGVSGLGLAIVSRIVQLHQGKCLVESELGKGSTFRIELKK